MDLRLDATLDGAPLLRDGLRYPAGAASPAVLGGRRHCGSVHLLGRRPDRPLPGVLELAGPGATARAVAPDADTLQRRLAPARARFLSVIEPNESLVHG